MTDKMMLCIKDHYDPSNNTEVNPLDAVDTQKAQINTMLDDTPHTYHREWEIEYHEGFYGYEIPPESDLEIIHDTANFIQKHGRLGAVALAYFDGNFFHATKAITDHYVGLYESLSAYVRSWVAGFDDILMFIEVYMDAEYLGRNMVRSGEIYIIKAGTQEVYVFKPEG